MASSQTTSMTFVGLGNMGTALTRAQMRSGADITVWNRSREKREVDELVTLGATFSPSLHAAMSASSIVIFCVLDYVTLYKILEEPMAGLGDESLRGKTIVNLTNGTPKDARAMDAWMRSKGALTYLDGGIMAGPDTVGTQECFVLYSGADRKTFDALQPILQVWGRAEYYGSDPGAAALTDLALLAGWYGMLQGAMVGISLLRKQKQRSTDGSGSGAESAGGDGNGVGNADGKNEESGPIERQVETLLNPFLQSFMASHVRIARAIENHDFAAHGHPMNMQSMAMQNVARGCDEEGIDTGVFKHFFGLVQKRVEESGGKEGIASLLDDLIQKKP